MNSKDLGSVIVLASGSSGIIRQIIISEAHDLPSRIDYDDPIQEIQIALAEAVARHIPVKYEVESTDKSYHKFLPKPLGKQRRKKK